MAPEIMKYNGEEEYTEKVDCFSFGMFLYELLTLHQPFECQETVKEVILEGWTYTIPFISKRRDVSRFQGLKYKESCQMISFVFAVLFIWSESKKRLE